MKLPVSQKLNSLAQSLSPLSIYVVGGFVRNFLIDGSISKDCDLAGDIPVELLEEKVKAVGYEIKSIYKRTQTLVFGDNLERYEYTAFREETYAVGGAHSPTETRIVSDIVIDAKRRDFKCNAVYYDIVNEKIVDPLGGVKDIEEKRLDTVIAPSEVFSHDGLRLMRLARFTGELNFKPTKEVIESAKQYSFNIKEISAERVYGELKLILESDSKYAFSSKTGHYDGLKVLDETRVLDYILPELTLGRGMPQRSDYHRYDVLEHSLRSVLYAKPSVRLYALLHDIGKPFAMQKDNKYQLHGVYGKEIVKTILTRLKAENKTIRESVFLTENHMLDIKSDMKEGKLKLFIVENYSLIEKLLDLKQADFSASKDDLSISPTVVKWREVIKNMKKNKVPFTLKELNISAKTLMDMGFSGAKVGNALKKLHNICVLDPKMNDTEKLANIVLKGKI